jgi:hypothetical protein
MLRCIHIEHGYQEIKMDKKRRKFFCFIEEIQWVLEKSDINKEDYKLNHFETRNRRILDNAENSIHGIDMEIKIT